MDRMRENFDKLFLRLTVLEDKVVRVNDKQTEILELLRSWEAFAEPRRSQAGGLVREKTTDQAEGLRRRIVRNQADMRYRVEAERAAREREDNRES